MLTSPVRTARQPKIAVHPSSSPSDNTSRSSAMSGLGWRATNFATLQQTATTHMRVHLAFTQPQPPVPSPSSGLTDPPRTCAPSRTQTSAPPSCTAATASARSESTTTTWTTSRASSDGRTGACARSPSPTLPSCTAATAYAPTKSRTTTACCTSAQSPAQTSLSTAGASCGFVCSPRRLVTLPHSTHSHARPNNELIGKQNVASYCASQAGHCVQPKNHADHVQVLLLRPLSTQCRLHRTDEWCGVVLCASVR